jgi:hypothetical protein
MTLSLLGSANLGVRGKHVIAAQRGVRRSAVSLRGSANLVRSGLRRNGPSDTASHHRPEAIAVTARCTPRKSQARHCSPHGLEETSELGRII